MQVDVRLEYDGTCEPHATGHNQMTAALITKCLDGFGKCVSTHGCTIAHGPEFLQIHLTVGNDRRFNFLHLERQVLSVLLVRVLSFATVLRLDGHCQCHQRDRD